jgi:hypothetical protein
MPRDAASENPMQVAVKSTRTASRIQIAAQGPTTSWAMTA